MGQRVTQTDVGKRVESHDGTQIGVASSVDEEAVYVEPDPGVTDSIRAALGWQTGADDAVPVQQAVIGEVTDDAIRLDREFAVQGRVGTASGRSPSVGEESRDPSDRPPGDPGLEVDPSELTDEEPTADVRSGEDVGSRADAAAGRDTGAERTDATAAPPTEPRREDARTERSASGTEGGPTTDDAGHETGDVDPMADAEARTTELDEPPTAPGERDDIGEIDEPGGPAGRTDVDEFGGDVDRSGDENRPDVADPASPPGESEPRDSSDAAERPSELDDATGDRRRTAPPDRRADASADRSVDESPDQQVDEASGQSIDETSGQQGEADEEIGADSTMDEESETDAEPKTDGDST